MSLQVTKKEHLTSRFSNAIEQLGSKEPDTKVGAIYALGRLALESGEDRLVITDLLIDFVRAKTQMDGSQIDPAKVCREGDATPRDVVAALRLLLFDLVDERRVHRVDLRRACLKGVEFPGADLTCVSMEGAVVYTSVFVEANFVRASLSSAQLEGSDFRRADFTGALAHRTEFGIGIDPVMAPADLREANLRDADLSRAKVISVDLSGADLTATVLREADLRDTVVSGGVLPTFVDDATNVPPGVKGTLSNAPAAPGRNCPTWSVPPPGCPETGIPVPDWLRCWLRERT
ncbi:pentapeptide repeat-containing protein [Actinoplanes sichuanensis]|uniref:Pentapeptide repeat-containing protein n=1 Tax=Actinoplanes sichuanensis TaxID=512349 RepID=A0ABW4AN22_9ACTN|nr:pentapeptide repeat-containing protein [Actinoplanes sichuanensis]